MFEQSIQLRCAHGRIPLRALLLLLSLFTHLPLLAKSDLAILPTSAGTQLTIYNSADLTLVRDRLPLTLRAGDNRLQFSWANTLIDPTSLELAPSSLDAEVMVTELVYPPRTQNLGRWRVESEVDGAVPFEISYLTSGLSWRAFYHALLNADESAMDLEAYVQVSNQSGEDYENAQVRLIVGEVNLIDQISELARRQPPYGRPTPEQPELPMPVAERAYMDEMAMFDSAREAMLGAARTAQMRPKEIVKQGLSEYFLYTIEGREEIPNGWSKRLPSFSAEQVPVTNLYKYDEQRYGPGVVRFLSFKNDSEHQLGETPIPGGALRLFRHSDDNSEGSAGALAYEGRSQFQYIPIGEEVELNLGTVGNVLVEVTPMEMRSDRYLFDYYGNVSGWDEVTRYQVEVKNSRPVPIRVEIRRNISEQAWSLVPSGNYDQFDEIDHDTVEFIVELEPRSERRFSYELTTRYGERAD